MLPAAGSPARAVSQMAAGLLMETGGLQLLEHRRGGRSFRSRTGCSTCLSRAVWDEQQVLDTAAGLGGPPSG